jgi:hypothetical protein
VLLDGVVVGAAPTRLPQVEVGDHILEVKAAGYQDFRQTIHIEGNRAQAVPVDLQAVPTTSAGPLPAGEVRAASSLGGRAVRRGGFTGDISFGYPYFFDGRLTAGVWSAGQNAVDGGIEVRTFGQFTDVAMAGRFQFVAADPIYVAAGATLGGGAGPNGRNTFFGTFGLGVTMAFQNLVSFSARTWLELYTDRFCPSLDDTQSKPRQECLASFMRPDGTLYDPRKDRDSGARWHLGAWVDVAATPHLSVFAGIWGVPFQDERLMFKDIFDSVFLDEDNGGDLKIYGQLGVSVKY